MVSDVAALTPIDFGPADGETMKLLSKGLARIAGVMALRGVNVVFQTAIPYMRDARCTPTMATKQWFNLSEPAVCNYYTREQTLKRRRPLDDVLIRLERAHPNFYVLDLVPTLCPGTVCKMRLDDGTYLYRDISSHLSVEANNLAQPALLMLVERALNNASTHEIDMGGVRHWCRCVFRCGSICGVACEGGGGHPSDCGTVVLPSRARDTLLLSSGMCSLHSPLGLLPLLRSPSRSTCCGLSCGGPRGAGSDRNGVMRHLGGAVDDACLARRRSPVACGLSNISQDFRLLQDFM